MTADERESAWAAVHDAIGRLPGWAIGPCVYHADDALWHVTAIDLSPSWSIREAGGDPRTGMTDIAALGALAALVEARRIDGR